MEEESAVLQETSEAGDSQTQSSDVTDTGGEEKKLDTKTEERTYKQSTIDTMQSRISKLASQNKGKEELLSEKERLLAELQEKISNKSIKDIKRPKEEEFDTNDEYLDAVDKYNDDRWEARQVAKNMAAKQEQAARQMEAKWDKLYSGINGLSPEKQEDVIDRLKDETTPYNQYMQQFVQESDSGLGVALHLQANKDVAEKIKGMNMIQSFNALNDISKNLVASSSSKSVSKAPKPAETIDGGGDTGSKVWEEMDTHEIEREMRKNGLI